MIGEAKVFDAVLMKGGTWAFMADAATKQGAPATPRRLHSHAAFRVKQGKWEIIPSGKDGVRMVAVEKPAMTITPKGQPGLQLSATPSPASPRTGSGTYTPEKKHYDDLAKEHFRSRGWQAFVIDRRGVRSADVLAICGNSLALIEVKSPHERAASPSWETRERGDSRNLSQALEARHGAYLRTARERACALLPGHSSFVLLYAQVIAAQLYRYYVEFEELASQYESFTRPINLRGVHFSKLPYLVVPAKYERELRTATEALAAHEFVVSPSFKTTPSLAMSSFSYHRRLLADFP
jgi:hypothetical protein